MSVTITKLIKKAQEKGFARVNGRMNYGMNGFTSKGKLEEKYSVKIDNDIVTLKHWGTETLKINKQTKQILNIYGESVSDKDSVNFVLNYFDLPYHTHYYPSKEDFQLHNAIDEVVETI